MIEKLKLWLKREFLGVDTSPEQFDIWFRRKLGETLTSSGVYYAICRAGKPGVPMIGTEFRVFSDIKEAQSQREQLQRVNRHDTFDLRVIRVFYSEVKS